MRAITISGYGGLNGGHNTRALSRPAAYPEAILDMQGAGGVVLELVRVDSAGDRGHLR